MKRIPVLIISGFLGAGKTTCIQRLLQEMTDSQRVMVIENDFGKVSYDADVLAAQGVRLKALPSGCICCSLAGNFLQALHSVLTKADVDLIIIEPSGVAKLSDILRVCERPEVADSILVAASITVVDGQKGLGYLQNFGEFFANQVQYADTILVNRVTSPDAEYDELLAALRQENGHARIVTMGEDDFSLRPIVFGPVKKTQSAPVRPAIPQAGEEAHEHHHHGDEIFTAITLEAFDILAQPKWQEKVESLLESQGDRILRLKGIVPSLKGYISIQYSGGPLVITPTDVKGQTLTVIGSQLDEDNIQRRWQ